MRVETKEEALEKIEKLEKETNEQATRRISAELKAETKLKARKEAVMNMYFELTGSPMSNADFEIYNYLFNKAEAGFNIKSWINQREQLIKNYNKEKEGTLNELINQEV